MLCFLLRPIISDKDIWFMPGKEYAAPVSYKLSSFKPSMTSVDADVLTVIPKLKTSSVSQKDVATTYIGVHRTHDWPAWGPCRCRSCMTRRTCSSSCRLQWSSSPPSWQQVPSLLGPWQPSLRPWVPSLKPGELSTSVWVFLWALVRVGCFDKDTWSSDTFWRHPIFDPFSKILTCHFLSTLSSLYK